MATTQAVLISPSPKTDSTAEVGQRPRLESIDVLRGLVMVFMALDHTKGHFWQGGFDPLNPDVTTFGAYFTRWITHFCAPTFCFLMGTGAYLAGRRGKTTTELFWFLFSRGVWLLVLEFTIVKLGMTFAFDTSNWVGIVYWSLGSCLIFLSFLVYLPTKWIAAIGLVMIVGHNLFDGVKAEAFGPLRPLWVILHQGGGIELAEGTMFTVAYPLVPWIGVVAVGFSFGAIYSLEAKRRQSLMLMLGVGLTVGFLVLRYANLYGDPNPWSPRATPLRTALSFFNTHKYPPSLLFLMMTLGPGLIALALLERYPVHTALSNVLLTFGRVPLFYWVVHWFVIGGLDWLDHWVRGGFATGAGAQAVQFSKYGLPMVYFWVFVVVAILYLPCRWFAGVKARNKNVWWLSYL